MYKKTILIISHNSDLEGPIDYYESYLVGKKNYVIKLAHPLNSYRNKASILSINKKIVASYRRTELGIINLAIDFILSIRFIIKYKIDVFIGANNFDVFVGIFCRLLLNKKINKIIYFASDFSEKRFKNQLLNQIYYLIEKFALKGADLTVSNTKRSEYKRLTMGLVKKKSLIVPNVIFWEKPIFETKKIHKNKFIYIGGITKEHGLLNILKTIRLLIKQLIIIGCGNEWETTEKFLVKNKIKYKFYNKRNHKFVINYLSRFNGFGLAPYNLQAKWVYYSSSLKINEYIACGVPVVTSDVTEISQYVELNNLGIVYHLLNLDEIKKKLLSFDTDNYVKRAKKFYYDYNYKKNYAKINI